ncbi:methyltransferase family protein [Saccharopolyspora erythraea NRRL 2338]|uniref:SAM-dependent methyltransferase n=3 Tax=Saccharopolyspora erythraea TaxID=1836 RepID=A4FEY9_SACEN|nr:class I SAM-dependent methyltransferase [Saccharopolyspora erythraea]PFG96340.1 methyltransferase family protein [Saccharopolyspora erythraea NRRL 2338]QRK92854.1 class I SAM-dependent methyltransferase [Saccharopolyspora erythraea]CAM02614.1 putative SAM-dependent methyltransferase [Saccharopolyspora erythraea NRRL 2338]
MSRAFEAAFGAASDAAGCTLLTSDGAVRPLTARRWSAPAGAADHVPLNECRGPVIDIGCGPGRLVAALAARGVLALGVDVSPVAVRLTRDRGGLALCRDVYDRLPGQGRWREALLIDGNIGIGGDPARLLRRVRELLRPDGRAWVEVEPPGTGPWRGTARLVTPTRRSRAFGWAIVGTDTIGTLAESAGLALHRLVDHDGRWFAALEPEQSRHSRREHVSAPGPVAKSRPRRPPPHNAPMVKAAPDVL